MTLEVFCNCNNSMILRLLDLFSFRFFSRNILSNRLYITVKVDSSIWFCCEKDSIYMNIKVTRIISHILTCGTYKKMRFHWSELSPSVCNCCYRAVTDATQIQAIINVFSGEVRRSRKKLTERNSR